MDKIDHRILNILKENGREIASDTSKAIHLSVSAVLDRIKKMEEARIIRGYTVRVDPKAIGNDVTTLMEISLEHPRFHDFFTEVIMGHPNILNCYYPIGDYDLVIKITRALSDEPGSVHGTIRSLPGVSTTKIRSVLKEIKNVCSVIPEL